MFFIGIIRLYNGQPNAEARQRAMLTTHWTRRQIQCKLRNCSRVSRRRRITGRRGTCAACRSFVTLSIRGHLQLRIRSMNRSPIIRTAYLKPIIKKLIIAGVIATAIAAYIMLDLGRYLSLGFLQQQLGAIHAFYADNTVLSWGFFLVIYIAVTALSIPGAAIMTLAAGAIFGFTTGLILVSFASAIGATLAFLVARYLFQDSVQRRFGAQLKTINDGIEKDGAFYLFTLRLVPIFPFFLINLAMALTPLRTWTYYWVSQVGMLAGTAVYVNAGTQVAQLESTSDILSADLLIAFALLGLLPWIARAIVQPLQRARLYRGWKKPSAFDRNLVVIGAGSGGLVSAYIAATVKASVTLVEKDRMGGDCLNTGCVPSKALIKSAEVASLAHHSTRYGLRQLQPEVDFAATMDRIQSVIGQIEPHDSVERYSALGVDCRQGTARLLSPWEVEITGDDGVHTLTTRNVVIASGAGPLVPPFPGLEQIDYLTTETLWTLRENPGRLLILGGGPIGCELAQSFARLGSAGYAGGNAAAYPAERRRRCCRTGGGGPALRRGDPAHRAQGGPLCH